MKLQSLFLAVFLVFSIAACIQADDVNYGNFDGQTVTYIDVTESSLEPLPLYGAPEVFGNDLHMPGTGFVTESNNGEINFLDGRLSFMIEADEGFTLDSITLQEFGTYFTLGEDSIASVSAIAFVEDLDGNVFAGNFELVFNGSVDPDSGDWLESLTIDFPDTKKITVTIDNQLFSFADDPGTAFIDKQGVNIIINKVAQIPEPSTAVLLSICAGGLALRSRRR